MFDRVPRLLDLLTLGCLLVVTGAVAFFLSTQPIAYQKSMALVTTPARESDWSRGPTLDLPGFIRAIPFRGSERVNLVRPSQLYKACIQEGAGNCANKSRGLSWFLTNEGIPFQRLDLLPIDGFLEGKGHTLIRTHYTVDGQDRVLRDGTLRSNQVEDGSTVYVPWTINVMAAGRLLVLIVRPVDPIATVAAQVADKTSRSVAITLCEFCSRFQSLLVLMT